MICVQEVKVSPSRISIKVGEWYCGTSVQVKPSNATNPSVKWSSSNPSVVSINANSGKIYGKSAGTATIYATAQDGSGRKDCCTVVVSQKILVRAIQLNKNNFTLQVGSCYTLSAIVSPTNATSKSVRWCSDNPDVATVSNGVVCAHSEGVATITVSATDGSGVTAHCSVHVYENISVSSVTVRPSCKTMCAGESAYLQAAVYPANATNKQVSWRSSDTTVAAVNPNSGFVTALSSGTATIFATAQDGSNKSGECTVMVSGGIIPVTSINIQLTSVKLQRGTSRKLSYTLTPSNATYSTVLWESSNTDVATVGNDDTVYAKSAGVADIVAYATDGSGIEDTCRVTVTNDILVTSITVSPSCKSMVVGESAYLHAAVCPENATNSNVFWESTNQDVATVNPTSGLVTARGPGMTTIYVMTQDGSGKKESCTVTVCPAVPVSSVTVSPEAKTMSICESYRLTATVYPGNATNKAVRWYSDNPCVATVTTTTGLITARADGTATITAMTVDGGFVSSCAVTVDSREVVNIVKDEENLNCFEVQFSNGMTWKNFGCGLSSEGTFATYGAENRYGYNCTNNFSPKQLAFIYLVDPLGVEYYVKTFGGNADAEIIDVLFFKDELYTEIFGVKPRYFREFSDDKIMIYDAPDEISQDFRMKVYSDAEVLFGFHIITDALTISKFLTNTLIGLFGNIEVISIIELGIELYQALFYAGSIKGMLADAIGYIETYESGAFQMLNWTSNLLGVFNAAAEAFAPPDAKDIIIYKKVDSCNYSSYFRIAGSDFSMKDIISRCEAI